MNHVELPHRRKTWKSGKKGRNHTEKHDVIPMIPEFRRQIHDRRRSHRILMLPPLRTDGIRDCEVVIVELLSRQQQQVSAKVHSVCWGFACRMHCGTVSACMPATERECPCFPQASPCA